MIAFYIRLGLIAVLMLTGMQIPGVVKVYEGQLEARLDETRQLLSGFEQIAAQFFDGDIQQLIQHHRDSEDDVFRAEADVIAAQVERNTLYENQLADLRAGVVPRYRHMALDADRELIRDSVKSYQPAIPADPDSWIAGLGAALPLWLLLEGGAQLLKYRRRPKKRIPPKFS